MPSQAADDVLVGARRYLCEHVAFAAAAQGYVQLGEKRRDPPYERSGLLRLLDIAVGLLPDSDLDANDLRDRMYAAEQHRNEAESLRGRGRGREE